MQLELEPRERRAVPPRRSGPYGARRQALLGVLLWLGPATAPGASNIVAWGQQDGPPGVPDGLTNVVAVAGGLSQSVALRADGGVVPWGIVWWGNAPPYGNLTNVAPTLTDVVGVAAGGWDCVALHANGTVVAWGDDSYGQTNVPPGLSNVVAVAAGADQVLALRSDHSVVGWGSIWDASGNQLWETNIIPNLTNAVQVAAGYDHHLALLAEGTVVAWGTDDYGQADVPAGLTGVVGIAGGEFHSVALKGDGTLVAWGRDDGGQCDVPPDLTNAVAIAAGAGHTLALRADGTVVAWGSDWYGQTNVPPGLTNVVGIGAGGTYSMAIIGAVMPPAHVVLTNVAFGPGGFTVQVPTDRQRVYGLEYTTSLANPQWTLLPLAAGTGGIVQLTDPAAGAARRFYRVRRW